MENYDKDELNRRKPLNIFSIILTVLIIIIFVFFYLD